MSNTKRYAIKNYDDITSADINNSNAPCKECLRQSTDATVLAIISFDPRVEHQANHFSSDIWYTLKEIQVVIDSGNW